MSGHDAAFMAEALAEARLGLEEDEFPVGAVLVHGGEVVARAHWSGIRTQRLLDHSEMLVLLEAERSGRVSLLRERRDSTLYTTLEPCALCMAASMSFLLGRIVFGAEAPVDGASNLPDVWIPPNGHPVAGVPYAIPEVVGGVEREASVRLIAEWVHRSPQRSWAAAYVPDG